jgi:hypothetical protein
MDTDHQNPSQTPFHLRTSRIFGRGTAGGCERKIRVLSPHRLNGLGSRKLIRCLQHQPAGAVHGELADVIVLQPSEGFSWVANPLGLSMLALSGDACAKKLRSLLAQRRVKRRLTQGELAMGLGKVQSYIAKIEIGDRSLNIADLIQICRALNASPVRLLKEAIEKSYTT